MMITALSQITNNQKGHIIAIGNFDGVHLGHRALLMAAKNMANTLDLKLGVLTFEPHPRKLFSPDEQPFRITPAPLKQKVLKECGVDFVLSLPFDWNFASQSADDFAQDILKNSLAPSHIFIGQDFRFGQLRKGNAQTIMDAGIPVTTISPIGDKNNAKYSSSDIRTAIRSGDIESANKILGWDWEIEGVIFKGDRRGHDLGYPTANMLLGEAIHPAYGIYATWVQIEGEDGWRMAATNIGIRPMFEVKQGQIEAHILDYPDIDIYGKNMRVRPVQRLRGEAKFENLKALIAQIDEDCTNIRKILTDFPIR